MVMHRRGIRLQRLRKIKHWQCPSFHLQMYTKLRQLAPLTIWHLPAQIQGLRRWISGPERADLRPKRADFRPERAWGTYGRTNRRTNGQTNRSPPVFYRTLSPLGPLPKKWIFFAILATLVKIFGHFRDRKRQKIHEQIKLQCKI